MRKILKYLSKEKYEIHVISVMEKMYEKYGLDYAVMEDLGGISITRTYCAPNIAPGIHDVSFYWLPFLFFELVAKIVFLKPDVIFFSCHPYGPCLLIPFIKIISKAKLVIDFKDPWVLNPYLIKSVVSPLSLIAEPFAVRYSSLIINVTERATCMYMEKYKESKSKFVTLYNGYDPQDIGCIKAEVRRKRKYSSFDIVYAGTFMPHRDPTKIFHALSNYIKKHNIKKTQIRFIWIGNTDDRSLGLLTQFELLEHSTLLGALSYDECLRFICDSDLCLVIEEEQAYPLPTKTFEYIAFDKPILAITEAQGELSQLLSLYPLAKVIVCGTVPEIEEKLRLFHEGKYDMHKEEQKLREFKNNAGKYINRRDQVKMLENMLDELFL